MASGRGPIVHVIGALVAGGAERFVVDLLCCLKRQSLDPALLILSSRRDEVGARMADALRDAEIPFECGPTLRVRLRSVLWYMGALRRMRPSMVHLHTTNSELAHFLAHPVHLGRIPLVRTVHNTLLPRRGPESFALRFNRAECSIACTEAARSANRDAIHGELVSIPNGVTFDWDVRSDAGSRAHKLDLGLDPAAVHFLSIGRFDGPSPERAQKAHDVLVKAWSSGELGRRGAELHLLGDGALRPAIQDLVRTDASVKFHGVRSDVRDWLQACDCFVMPSRWEGLPIAGIEAAGSGLPCILSRVEALAQLKAPEVLWTEVDDVDGLAMALRKFCEHPSFPARADTETFRVEFGMARTARSYAAVYRRVLGG